jgi:hypothetical protein
MQVVQMQLFKKKGEAGAKELATPHELGLQPQGMERAARSKVDLAQVQWGDVRANPVNDSEVPPKLPPAKDDIIEAPSAPRLRTNSRAQKRQLSDKRALAQKSDLTLSAVQMYPAAHEHSNDHPRMSTHPVSKPMFKSMSTQQLLAASDWDKRKGLIHDQGKGLISGRDLYKVFILALWPLCLHT